jgi:putative hydrolase of the HAD superfamily
MQRCSVFLTPCCADFEYTANLIREMCGTCDGHPFEPHVTVYSGAFPDPDALREVVSAATTGIRPFSLRVRRIGCREEYFRSLFIEFDEDPVLSEIRDRIKAAITCETEHVPFPHLSLLYCDGPLRDKEALAKQVALDRRMITFDELKIVTPGNLKEGWRDTAQWQTLFRVRLYT